MDGSGNVAILTPDTTPDESRARKSSVYNRYTGMGHTIDLVALADAVQSLTGRKDIITEFSVPRTDWDKEQADKKAKRDAEITEKTKAVAAWEAEAAAFEELTPEEQKERSLPEKPVVPDPYTVRPKPQWLTDALAAEEGK
jgi:hypothetical protein